ncbi:RNA polymerase sigma factor, sigma-70 family [Butyrivibrio fibrisolvens DSM 3071]|uniref:RNA polymerase sigma factor, sigma-70 family n=1 Tax=Butyrivibrio fibrisolvens DSM 3071 TaxID=1121131 RepID=A0A1M6E3E9_BUTFI|nr:sigma-70 family RNA polymerase sigma factor [Butyrivibrio fibrisolvens]SHI79925.1 RNA polymerase sigma factor, sigma-70 family [Butyrivibrio fibrisolvens DSM 3071]
MIKENADKLIIEYSPKIYGFAVKKAFSLEESEELAAEMVKEVYLSLLEANEVFNVEGYVWRICEHTYAKYVNSTKKHQGISLDGMEIPYYDNYNLGEKDKDLKKLRQEIGFLSEKRRQIIYSFYYEGKSIQKIATEEDLSEGTIKWHLNKARNDLKENFSMERKVGSLGISPIEAICFDHNGQPGIKGGPEVYLDDKINLNIVYSVYDSPKTKEGIAEEMGMTPVYLEDRIAFLAKNGFLVETSGKRYTTYVKFTPRERSLEQEEEILKSKIKVADSILKNYVPKVKEAIKKITDIYIPSGNPELFEATAIFYAIANKFDLPIVKNVSPYLIKTLDGGEYYVTVNLKSEIIDPDFKPILEESTRDYTACGSMTRNSWKYPTVKAWSNDNRFSTRKGMWQNNLNTDYDAIYEVICGDIEDNKANEEKFKRLRERGFITDDGRLNVLVVKKTMEEFDALIPSTEKEQLDEFAKIAIEQAVMLAKNYPPQMQDFIVFEFVKWYVDNTIAMIVLDKLYDSGEYKPLTQSEKATVNLLVFSDRLPQ